jgi:hypothetical protein
MFEPSTVNEMYFSPIPQSTSLIYNRFCEFHDSPLFNLLQMDLWQRIRKAIDSTLTLHNRLDLYSPIRQFSSQISSRENISSTQNESHSSIAEDFEPDMTERLPSSTHCPSQSAICFPIPADFQVIISAGFPPDCFGVFVRTLMVAAILCRDDGLLEWLKMVADIRYNTEVCEEFMSVLPQGELFQLRDLVRLSHEVYGHALMIVAAIQSKLVAGDRYGYAKI